MGCDIHLYAERRTSEGWERAEALVPNPHLRYASIHPQPALVHEEWYEDRNYALFGILAGVRDPDVPCIELPRGLPSDLSPSLRSAAEYWEDAHSRSFFTLAELLAFEWDTPWSFWDGEKTTLLGMAGPSFLSLLLRLQEIAASSSPEDVRIVFWFDS